MANKIDILSRRHIQDLLIFFFVVGGIILRSLGLNKSIWLDEGSSLGVILSSNFWSALNNYDHPPLYFLFMRYWSSFGESEVWLRLPSVLIGGLTIIILVILSGRENRRAGVIISLLAATLPILVFVSQQIRGYAFLIFFASLSFVFAQNIFHGWGNQTRNAVLLSISLALCSSIHLVGIFLVPGIIVFLLLKPGKRLPYLVFLLIVFIPSISFSLNYFLFIPSHVHARSNVTWGPSKLNLELLAFVPWYYSGFTEAFMGIGKGLNFLFGIPVVLPKILAASMLLLTFVNLKYGNFHKSLPYLLSGLTIWIGLIIYSLFFVVIFSERTALIGLVPILIFLSLQIGSCEIRWVNTISLIAGGILFSGYTLNWVSTAAWTPVENWKDLSYALDQVADERDLIIAYPGYVIDPLRYYIQDLGQEAYVYISPAILDNQVKVIQELIVNDDYDQIFLVVRSDATVWENTNTLNLLEEMLSDITSHPEVQNFGRLSLKIY